MRAKGSSRCWLRRVAACVPLAVLAACVAPAAPVVVSPVAARIWFYRDYEPSVSLNMASVALNGTTVAYVEAFGNALYRDVPAGRYHITAATDGRDFNQARDVDLAPGQEAFVKILASSSWEAGGNLTSYRRDTFYVSLVPAQIARAELAAHPLRGG